MRPIAMILGQLDYWRNKYHLHCNIEPFIDNIYCALLEYTSTYNSIDDVACTSASCTDIKKKVILIFTKQRSHIME